MTMYDSVDQKHGHMHDESTTSHFIPAVFRFQIAPEIGAVKYNFGFIILDL